MAGLVIRKYFAPEILFGEGCRKLTGQYAKNLGMKKVMLVTDQGVIKAGWTRQIIESLEESDIEYAVFSKVSPNPRDYEVMEGARFYKSENCDGIIAIGGGSAMDCAKGIGIVTTNNEDILYFTGVDRIKLPIPPLICIPTTAGTSSDVSQFTIILNTSERLKIAIVSKAIVPDIALIDPETTTTMNSYLIATTGIDALVHAIEAFVSKGSSSITDINAIAAIELAVKYLPIRYKDPTNGEAMSKMMLASMQAGLAFSNAILGIVHSMAHSLGGFLDLPHGECNAILLENIIDFNYDSIPERYDVIAGIFGLKFKNETALQRKAALMNSIVEFKKQLGIERKLAKLGVNISDIPILAYKAYNDPNTITNPKNTSVRDIEVIFEDAM